MAIAQRAMTTSERSLCPVCKGEGRIIVCGAVCTVPTEKLASCPECKGEGLVHPRIGSIESAPDIAANLKIGTGNKGML